MVIEYSHLPLNSKLIHVLFVQTFNVPKFIALHAKYCASSICACSTTKPAEVSI